MAVDLARASVPPVCGGCGSDNLLLTPSEGPVYGLCVTCGRLQEVETRSEPLLRPCDNCAYRPDSPERADHWGWAEHRDRHVEGGVPFYCHKGLPLEFDPSGHTHVIDGDATRAEAVEKPCAGWIATRLGWLQRRIPQCHPATETGE